MRRSSVLPFVVVLWSAKASAVDADPSTYQAVLATLKPGDTLNLAGGTYTGLEISGLNGTEASPIVIAGPSSGAPAIVEAKSSGCCNTVEIVNSSYVVLRNLVVDSKGLDGVFGISAKDGLSNLVHHITVEGCTVQGAGASQNTCGISTKTPTWGWTIRGNKILGAGTGLYLGNSNGEQPFVAGVIENNLVLDPIGYCLQIKWQQTRPTIAGMPTGESATILRHNVFIKNDQPSPEGDRPNVLLGGFPDSGAGAQDLYQVYGNFFYHNPRESLLQVSGRVSIHDNIFVDAEGAAIRLQNHDLPLKLAHVYNNTIYSTESGIAFGNLPSQEHSVVGNLLFSDNPIAGSPTNATGNLSDSVSKAADYVVSPSTALGSMDFYPLAGKCEGASLDLSAYATEAEYDRDFNSQTKGGFAFRGAYAGVGTNPGWKLAAELKGVSAAGAAGAAGVGGAGGSAAGGGGSATGGSATGGSATGGSATGGGGSGGSGGKAGASGSVTDAGAGGPSDAGIVAPANSSEAEGCGCRTERERSEGWWALVAILAGFLGRRRSRRPEQSQQD